MEWDYEWFKLINNVANNETMLGRFLVHAANWGDYFFFFSLLIMLLFKRKMAVYACISVGSAVMSSRWISLVYFRERPFVAHDVNLLLPHVESNSFPSDHACAAFAIAMMFFMFSKRIGYTFIAFAAIVSFSRIWAGKHYPTDVIAGALLGILIAIIVYRILEKLSIYERLLNLFSGFFKKNHVKSEDAPTSEL